MKGHSSIGAVLFVVVVGVGTSLLIFPRYEQVSLMIADSGEYQAALQRFQKQIASGKEDLPTLVSTVHLLQENGRDREAIHLVENYVDSHPNDNDAMQYLAQLYRHAVRLDEYVEVLWALQGRQPTEKYLHDIALYSSEIGNIRSEQAALEQLFQHYPMSYKEYQRLAYFYAAQEKGSKAIEVMRTFIQTTPMEKISYLQANYIIRLFIYEGYQDDAASVAAAYVGLKQNRKEYFDILSIFADENVPKVGLAVLAVMPADMRRSKRGEETRFDLLLSLGQQQEAYELLMQAVKNNQLSTRLFRHGLPLTLDNVPHDLFMTMIKQIDLKGLQPDDLVDVAIRSVQRHEPDLAQYLRDQLGQEYLNTYPVLMLALALGIGDVSEEQAFNDYNGVRTKLSGPDNSVLATLYEMRGLDKLAKQLLDTIQSLDDYPPEQVFNLTAVLAQHRLEQKAISLVKPLIDELRAPPIEIIASWKLLQGTQGQQDLVISWMQGEREIPSAIIKGIYEAAYKRQLGPLALVAAQKLYRQLPSQQHEAYVASAQVINGQGAEGLDRLRQLFKAGVPVTDLYVNALIYLQKTQPSLKTELTQVIAKEASDPHTPDSELRDLGYLLIENHLKAMAEPLFFRLAQENSFRSGDAFALLDIWGPHPRPAQSAWIVEHARAAPIPDEVQWLRYLIDTQQPGLALDVLHTSHNDEHSSIALVELHYQASVAVKDYDEADKLIDELLTDGVKLDKVLAWAKMAKDSAFFAGAERLYLYAMDIDPGNIIYWKELGLIAWERGDFCLAANYLSVYLCCEHVSDKEDYLCNYIYGELLWHDKCYDEACRFYVEAWNLIEALAHHQQEDQVTLAHIFVRLECYDQAEELYKDLICRYPLQLGLYADLAELYIILERYSCACRALTQGFEAADIAVSQRQQLAVTKETSAEEPQLKQGLSEKDLHVVSSVSVTDKKDREERDRDFVPSAADIDAGVVLLQATRLHLLRECNHVCEALAEAEQLAEDHPCSVDALVTLAELQLISGRWVSAVDTLDYAVALQPARTALFESRDLILADHSPYLSANTEYRVSGPQHEWLGRLHCEDCLWRGNRIYADFETDGIHFNDFMPFNTGVPERFVGSRERGAIGIEQLFCGGQALRGTLLLADGIVGAGTKLALPDPSGVTVIDGAIYEPCWDLLQSTIQKGIRHHVGIGRTQRFFPRLEVNGSFTFNVYNLFVNTWAATSYQILAGVLYKISPLNCFVKLWGRDTDISLAYSLEMEEVLSELSRPSAQGGSFQPLGLSDRQVHTGCMIVNKKWTECWAMDGSAGYSYDAALHHGGAMGTFGLTYGRKGCPQARLYYYHVINSVGSATAVDSVLFEVRTPF